MNFGVRGVDHQPFAIRLVNHGVEQIFPDALVAPANKTPMNIAPPAIIGRQIPPRRAGAQNPENGVDEKTVIFGDAAPNAFAPGQVRLQ